MLSRVTRALFAARRKTIKNNAVAAFGPQVLSVLERQGIDPSGGPKISIPGFSRGLAGRCSPSATVRVPDATDPVTTGLTLHQSEIPEHRRGSLLFGASGHMEPVGFRDHAFIASAALIGTGFVSTKIARNSGRSS